MVKNVKRAFLWHVILMSITVLSFSIAYAGTTERVSVSTEGMEGNNSSYNSSLSADSRYVVFESLAGNLVNGDTNGTWDIFVHDGVTNMTERVSVSSEGIEGNGASRYPHISADGRYIAFQSRASNLVAGGTNGSDHIFVHNMDTGNTELIAKGKTPSLNADGRYVAYDPSLSYISVHDRVTGNTETVSVSSSGQSANGPSQEPSLSADGEYVVFNSYASNLVENDTNNEHDIFVHERSSGTTVRVSVNNDGIEGNSGSTVASISGNGRYVAFYSWADNLVPGDTNGQPDIFVHDRQTQTTTRVSVHSDGSEANNWSGGTAIDYDGRYVAFMSHGNNLAEGDTNGHGDVFVHDTINSTTELVSVNSDGIQGNIYSFGPSISADGGYVAFQSLANNLVPDDRNGKYDIFVVPSSATGGPCTDSDSDGICDDDDLCPGGDDTVDTDGDSIPDFCDACPNDSENDSDGDGVCGDTDICQGGDDTVDTDGDSIPDFCDACPNDSENDNDGDGVCGDIDICEGGDDTQNADGDSLPDFCDVCPNDSGNDAEGDGICESDDNCPMIANADQFDTDGDGEGDACDEDDDNDGVFDANDNCQFDINTDQSDFDSDGAGDVCDTDDDNDGVLDAEDQCINTMPGETINGTGCSIADLCPCDNPWKNHGGYVKCVAHTSETFVADGLITEADKDAIVSEAGQSDCGSKK